MSGATMRCAFPRASRRGRPAERERASVEPSLHEKATPVPGPSRACRMLALAHHIERLIEAGQLSDYAQAAGALGLTRARLTHVMNLPLLSPAVQEQVLAGDLEHSEHRLRSVTLEPDWATQLTTYHGLR